ncbi:NADH dehydrogenase (ubiquinone) 1 alpha subcomplex subunit 4, partial [Phenoliferia sp. Uapishka_3]
MVASRAIPAARSTWKIWYEPAAIPIYVTVGVACAGAGWYLTRLALSNDIVWDRVPAGSNTKLMTINKEFFAKKAAEGKGHGHSVYEE